MAFVAHISSFLLSHCRFYQKHCFTSTLIKVVILRMKEISPLIPPTVRKSHGNTLQAHWMVLLSPKPIQGTTDTTTKESTHIAPPVRLTAFTPLPSLAEVYKPSLCSKVQTCWGCTWPTKGPATQNAVCRSGLRSLSAAECYILSRLF